MSNKTSLALVMAMVSVLAAACSSTAEGWSTGGRATWGDGGYDPGSWGGFYEAGAAPDPSPCWWDDPGSCPQTPDASAPSTAGDGGLGADATTAADASDPVDANADDDASVLDDDAGTVDDAGAIDDDAGIPADDASTPTDAGTRCRHRRRDGGCR